MVKGDKRNKREYERRNQKQEDAKNKPRNDNPDKNDKRDGENKAPPSNFQGVKEDATKLITEANQRFLEERQKKESTPVEDKWKKTITSNWDRYEIVSDDEEDEEDALTGQSWELAMGSGASANSHIKLKGEQDWSTRDEVALSKEFFSLDLGILDGLIKCVPLHDQISLDEKYVDEESLESFTRKAAENTRLLGISSEDCDQINQKMLSLLSTSSETKQSSPQEAKKPTASNSASCGDQKKDENSSSVIKKTECGGSNKLSQPSDQGKEKTSAEMKTGAAANIPPPAQSVKTGEQSGQSAPQEQRQRRNRNRRAEPAAVPSTDSSVPSAESSAPSPPSSTAVTQDSTVVAEASPVATKSSSSVTETSTTFIQACEPSKPSSVRSESFENPSSSQEVKNSSEKDDLEFLESLEKNLKVDDGETVTEAVKDEVVSVSIIDAGEKKGLEDWLDDFLGD